MNGAWEWLKENPIGVLLVVTIYLVKYLRIYYTTNIDLLFMRKKEEQKRFLARFLVLCSLLVVINFIVSILEAFVILVGLTLLIACIAGIIVFAVSKFLECLAGRLRYKYEKMDSLYSIFQKYKNTTTIGKYVWLILFLICGPIITYFIGKFNNYDSNLMVVIVSVAQTFIIFIQGEGFISEESKITINERKGKRTLYVYKKVNDEYLLCGDDPKMKNAKEISTIKIDALYSDEFYLGIESEKR